KLEIPSNYLWRYVCLVRDNYARSRLSPSTSAAFRATRSTLPTPRIHRYSNVLSRDARDFNKPIGAERISKHISSLSALSSLPKDAKLPNARAIGSTAAIKQGASVDDVVVQGHWSSSILFDQFYRLNAATTTNFTSMVLS
ncbi:hypothetical protein BGX28_005035, partial [Mortierella sp. GBA30]